MKSIFEAADRYIRTSSWKTVAVLKFCLVSLGMMVGMMIKPQNKKAVFSCAICVFLASYVPLMVRFYKVFTGKEQ